MATPRVKAEPKVKPDPAVKSELDDATSPSSTSSEDIYEDAGDLEFFDPENMSDASVYLAHVPKYLYDAWKALDEDTERQIGTVRSWEEKGPNGEVKQRMAVLLDHSLAPHQQLPKEYNLDIKDMNLTNTFLFTEQDLPGFKSKARQAPSDIPSFLRPKRERSEDEREKDEEEKKRGRKKKIHYRKAIPKKTILRGRFRHELNCQPVWTPETRHWLSIRNTDAMKPRATTTLTSSARPTNLIQAGAHVSNDKFSNFVRSAPEVKKGGKKPRVEKAARLPESVLRDKIFQCFERYNYWSMRAFRTELKQPEAWLRENLDKVAILHKTGTFANCWELNGDYRGVVDIFKADGVAPDLAPNGEDEGDVSESDAEMEDVIPA
ncbi:transcription initiation factor iif [Annulohypoxylon nitens]|nr:transcription initiation factor iif [Annulohypoxylon nitens]